MLHRMPMLLKTLGFLLALLPLTAGADPRLRAPITGAERAALAARIAPQVVHVRRDTPPPRNVTIPGHGPLDGFGWWAAPGRVITASALVQGWPQGDADKVLVRAGDGAWRPATVGLIDIRLGLAVLDVEGAPGDPVAPPDEAPKAGAIFGGRTVYAAHLAEQDVKAPRRLDGGLINVLIAGPAGGALGYYWQLGGPLGLGTPLFDVDGRLVTLVGLQQPTGGTFVLPIRAIEALYERKHDWLP